MRGGEDENSGMKGRIMSGSHLWVGRKMVQTGRRAPKLFVVSLCSAAVALALVLPFYLQEQPARPVVVDVRMILLKAKEKWAAEKLGSPELQSRSADLGRAMERIIRRLAEDRGLRVFAAGAVIYGDEDISAEVMRLLSEEGAW